MDASGYPKAALAHVVVVVSCGCEDLMQTCLRCGASLEPDDTVCFTCGAPVGESKTPTQPVPVPKAVRERTGALPAIQVEAAVRNPAASRPLPPVSAPFTQPDKNAPQRAKVRRWPFLLLAAVLIGAVALAGGVVLRASLAGPPVPKTVIYHDPAGRFQAHEPALWSATSEPDGVLFADSTNTSALTSTIEVNVTPPPSLGTTAASQADALAKSLHLAATVSATETFAGTTWEQREGTTVGSDGAEREALVEVTLARGEVYAVTCETPLSSFDNTNALVFQPFLASFTLG